MIEHISKIVDRVINNAKLAQLENKVLDKYESLIAIPEKPKDSEASEAREVKQV